MTSSLYTPIDYRYAHIVCVHIHTYTLNYIFFFFSFFFFLDYYDKTLDDLLKYTHLIFVLTNIITFQKWERENNSLPISQRRPKPKRPEVPIDHSEWNAVAWEESQVFIDAINT